jgi:hypothetical protein
MTKRTVHAWQIVQILGISLIFVLGEKHLMDEIIFAFTDVGGVPLTICSIINSHMNRGEEEESPERFFHGTLPTNEIGLDSTSPAIIELFSSNSPIFYCPHAEEYSLAP